MLKESLEKSRKERRAKARQPVLSEDQRCVICVTNPKEVNFYNNLILFFSNLLLLFFFKIICLPCGHVCLCEDCAAKIKLQCPVCRTKIESKAAAFIL